VPVATVARRIWRAYGAEPLHLLALLACFGLAGFVALRLSHEATAVRMLVWFAGAVIGHDLVLFPLYALADRSMSAALTAVARRRTGRVPAVPPLNYLRAPAAGAILLLLLFLPGIVQQGRSTYLDATGQTQQPFLARWMLLSAAMFLVSAVTYAWRLRRVRAGRTSAAPAATSRTS
jgi:hypothetical protein